MATVWDTLGIGQTDDVGAVRSAYARALKLIDMDADPRAYIALREARDHAIQMIRYAAREAAQEGAEAEQATTASAPEVPEAPGVPVAIPDGTYEEHLGELTRLFAPAGENPAAAVDAAIVRGRFTALLADPRMEQIAFRAQAEAQLAHLIAVNLPRSAMLVGPAMTAFGWVGPSRIDTPPAIAAILDAAQAEDQPDANRAASSDPAPGAIPSPTADDSEDSRARFFADQYNSLVALLFPQQDDAPPLTREEERTASGLFATLLCDPRMELVTFRVSAEAQFAQMIAYSIPRSDCILPRAIAFFHWEETQGQIDQADAIARILHRERGLRFVHAVQSRDHPFHAAWQELRTPVNPKRPAVGAVHSGTIYKLLNSIRTEQPLLERELDAPRVALWDEKLATFAPSSGSAGQSSASSQGSFPIWRVLLFAFLLLSGLARLATISGPSDADSSGAAGPPRVLVGTNTGPTGTLDPMAADVDPVLAEIGGNQVTMTLLQSLRSPLAVALTDQWTRARDGQQDLADFQKSAEKLVLDQIAITIRNSTDGSLITDYQRQRADSLGQLMDTAPGDCIDLGRPGKVVVGDAPGFLSQDRKDLFARVLQAPSSGFAPIQAAGPQLGDGLLTTIGSKIGAPPARTRMLLSGWTGTYGEQCRARIAEIRTLLDLPKTAGTPLLRLL